MQNIQSDFIGEFIGTYILSLSVCTGNDLNGKDYSHLRMLSGIYIAIMVCRPISEADYNPCVSYLKYLVYGTMKPENHIKYLKCMHIYWIYQIAASILGFMTWYCLFGFTHNLTIGPNIDQSVAFFIEIFCTCILLFVIAMTLDKDLSMTSGSSTDIISIISAIGCGCALGGNISGAGMNPAVGIGSNFVRYLVTGNTLDIKYLWIYILAPFISARLIAYFYINIYKYNKKLNF